MTPGAVGETAADRPASSPSPAGAPGRMWSVQRVSTPVVVTGSLLCILVLVGGIGLLSIGVTAAEPTESATNETTISAPVLEHAERVNETAIAVTIETEAGLDPESVTPSEFFLSAGTLDSVAVINTTSDDHRATVELRLAGPIAEDEVVIGVASSTRIADTAGNTLNTTKRSSVSVTGMDSVPPDVLNVDVPTISTNETTLGYQFDQRVADLDVTISGPTEEDLTRDDFTEGATLDYTADITLAEEGEYTVTLHEATDEAGNTAVFDIESKLEINTSVPTAIAAVNRSASERTTVVFDGYRSNSSAESFDWSFGDGETASGEQVEHTFHPGVYVVTLETTDTAGNVGTDSVVVEVSRTTNSPRVGPHHWPNESEIGVERLSPAFGTDTLVEFVGVSAGETVTAADGDEPLTTTDETTLESVSVTPTVDTSIGLGLTGIESDGPIAAGFAEKTELKALGGFTADTTVSSEVLDETEVTMTVSDNSIAELDATIDDVALYHGTETWNELETAVRDEGDGYYKLTATSDGFSSFMLGVPDDEQEDDDAEREDGEQEESDGEVDDGEDEEDDEADSDEANETDESDESNDEADDEDGGEDESEVENDSADEEESAENESETDDSGDEETPPTEPEQEDESSGAFLGIIPHWLITTALVFVALPLFAGYTGLKAIAFYLGY